MHERRARLHSRQHDGRALPPRRKLGLHMRCARRGRCAAARRPLALLALARVRESQQRGFERAQPRGQPPRAQLALVAAQQVLHQAA